MPFIKHMTANVQRECSILFKVIIIMIQVLTNINKYNYYYLLFTDVEMMVKKLSVLPKDIQKYRRC